MLNARDKMMDTRVMPENVSEIDDTRTAEALLERLQPARARVREMPSPEAVARIRARVFDEVNGEKKQGRIAA
jgi:hypothetical protein